LEEEKKESGIQWHSRMVILKMAEWKKMQNDGDSVNYESGRMEA